MGMVTMWIGTVAGRIDPRGFAEMTPLLTCFARDVDVWFGYAKLIFFCYISASLLRFNMKHK